MSTAGTQADARTPRRRSPRTSGSADRFPSTPAPARDSSEQVPLPVLLDFYHALGAVPEVNVFEEYTHVISVCQAYYLITIHSYISRLQSLPARRSRGRRLSTRDRGLESGLWLASICRAPAKHRRAALRQWLRGRQRPGAAGECTPPLDVIETAAGIEIVLDVPGVSRVGHPTIMFSRHAARRRAQAAGVLRARASGVSPRRAHLRRFARAVRRRRRVRRGPRDAPRCTAGELRIVLPRLDERRGREIRIPINSRVLMKTPVHRRHLRQARARNRPARDARARRAPRDRLRHRQRRELRRRLRRHRRHRRHDPRLRRRRDDDRQSHLGQEGGPRLHPAPAASCCGPANFPAGVPGRGAISAGRAPASRSA